MVGQLLHSAEDIEILLSCAILIHDNTPSNVSSLPPYSQLLLDRDRCLSLALESVVSAVIEANPSDEGIDLAVGRVWPDYRPGSEWMPLPHENSNWFLCTTASTTSQSSQVVHSNLLDGSLLVDGKPLSRLPKAIVQHPLYNLIFGEVGIVYDVQCDAGCWASVQQVFDVIPGDLPGMDYSTQGMISGHRVSALEV